ncbi:MAG TPA: glycosyltransferase [Bacteroidales bacterium]|nr:glycosyltransferase [Bacteroidales bacterium]
MELSVIIVSYNVRHFLEQCLLSVYKALEGIDSEVFVIDNNSADGSSSMVSGRFPYARLIINHENRGFSAANNQALKLAKGKYALLINPDTLVEEETFRKCIAFMDDHPEAGAAGVRMIDGKGRFLPESKRAIPTPGTAFFKISGMSRLFPHSGLFNRYYLGNLDNNITTPAEVISGAFMFIRHEALLKTGLLDEDYFMYGEDIDFSYRLIKSGYINYYYPGTKIIHYKGESTKKEQLNVLLNFYRAMLIFVRKHFNSGTHKWYIFLMQTAIFFRAGLSLLKRIVKKLFLPISDGFMVWIIFRLAASVWGNYRFGPGYNYPVAFTGVIVPVYTIIIVLSIAMFAGYRKPSAIGGTLKGICAGLLAILVLYALLPLGIRFSRAVIIIGGLISMPAVALWRIVLSAILPEYADNPFKKERKTIIISDSEGYKGVKDLLESSSRENVISGRVSINPDDKSEEVLGNLQQLKEVVRINKIKEVILDSRNLNSSVIIGLMHSLADSNISVKIASSDGKYILGSRYVNPNDYVISMNGTSFWNRLYERLRRLFK